MSINSLINFGVPGQNGERSTVLQPIITNRFRVVFYNFGNPGETAPYDMTRAIRSVGRPNYKFEKQTIHSYISTVYLPTRVQFDTTNVKLFDDIDNSVQKRIQQQISKQQNFFDQTAFRAGQNIKFEMDVDVLAGGASAGGTVDPNIIQKWSFVGCFVESADLGELSYQEANLMENSMTISFDNCIAFDQDGNRLGTFDHGPQIDGRIGDFTTGIGGIS